MPTAIAVVGRLLDPLVALWVRAVVVESNAARFAVAGRCLDFLVARRPRTAAAGSRSGFLLGRLFRVRRLRGAILQLVILQLIYRHPPQFVSTDRNWDVITGAQLSVQNLVPLQPPRTPRTEHVTFEACLARVVDFRAEVNGFVYAVRAPSIVGVIRLRYLAEQIL